MSHTSRLLDDCGEWLTDLTNMTRGSRRDRETETETCYHICSRHSILNISQENGAALGALPASSGCPARRTSSSPGGESLMLLPGPDFRSAGVGRARLVDSRRWHKEILLAAKMKKIDEVENVGSLRQYNQVMNRSLQRDLRPKFGHSALSHHP